MQLPKNIFIQSAYNQRWIKAERDGQLAGTGSEEQTATKFAVHFVDAYTGAISLRDTTTDLWVKRVKVDDQLSVLRTVSGKREDTSDFVFTFVEEASGLFFLRINPAGHDLSIHSWYLDAQNDDRIIDKRVNPNEDKQALFRHTDGGA